MRIATGLAIAFACSTALATEPAQRTLSFEERVKAQTSIERVYYSHQLGATKTFDDAVPKAVLEAKVHKYLDQTAALNAFWKTAVTDYSLQRELERMAQGTKMPERLVELYAALGNDPFLVKECLARPALVDRLTHNFYAFDPTQHVKARGQAEALHRMLVSGELSPTAEHPNRTVTELVVSETGAAPTPTDQPSQRRLPADAFQKQRAELPRLPGQVSEIRESREAFAFNVILNETTSSVRVASYLVAKTPFDEWWGTARRTVSGDRVMAVASVAVVLPVPRQGRPGSPSTTCADDGWDNGVLDDLPHGRIWHTTVWTGSQMIVWGGLIGPGVDTNTGGRYDPATDSWTSTSTVGAPVGRPLATAVWTGTEMVVWGGGFQFGVFNTGGRYDPISDSWTPTSTSGAPYARTGHLAVWTGSVMVVWGGWGGVNGANLNFSTGGRYDPATNSWTPTSTNGSPTRSTDLTAVWTGNMMVVWGGRDYPRGGRYDPVSDSWAPMSMLGTPSGREDHTAVWTGSRMVVWGGTECRPREGEPGCEPGPTNTGGSYDPVNDVWTPVSTIGAPSARSEHSAVWTGRLMVIWGQSATGGRYDPATDSWTPTAETDAPSHRTRFSAVWTGSLMVVWGGDTGVYEGPANTGGRYDPTTDSWTPTSMTSAPSARSGHTAVWTGNLMVDWGGLYRANFVDQYLDTGGRYDPTLDDWTSTSTMGAPTPRQRHTAVWTGNVMVVWGGFDGNVRDTGARYDPVADAWTSTSSFGAPVARLYHSAVWTGNVMVVWGGSGVAGLLGTGGRYDPLTDSWTATSLTGAPSERLLHAAVWTTNRMVIWGGSFIDSSHNEIPLDTGARYDPATDSWTPTTSTGAPFARSGFSAVSTGGLMVVWGGRSGSSSSATDTGGRYDPGTDAWTPTSTTGAPTARDAHAAVSTGNLMVVLGGNVNYNFFPYSNAGGWYSPTTDRWTKITKTGEPPSTYGPAVWTGSAIINWSGANGGRYSLGTSLDADCDGDGVAASAGDCNERDASVYPGAPQACDGVNNDCDDPAWPIAPTEDDFDQDGFRFCQGDCNDRDATVYPGASQLCDGVNNDCSDPAPPNESDSDHDGFRTCQGDCNDNSPYVYPGAREYCDGADNDCGGVIDEGGDALCPIDDPCFDGTCAGTGRCVFTANTAACDDGNSCTSADVCGDGSCQGTPLEGATCDDANVCTSGDVCSNYSCHGVPTLGNPCDDGNVCTTGDTCGSGWCQGGSLLSCDNGNACDGFEYCMDFYGCVTYIPPACDDGNPCTDDGCDPTMGCIANANTSPCVDGDPCTADDVCNGGSCAGAPTDGPACDDGNACTTNDACADGTCLGGAPINCDDGNICNGTEVCATYYGCYSVAPLNCDDGNVCTTDGCIPTSGCVHGDVVCDDRNDCTTDTCNPITGGCVFAPDGRTCNDNNPCTDDSCNPETGACDYINNDSNTCSGDNPCMQVAECHAGVCGASIPVQCIGGCPPGFVSIGAFCQRSYYIDASLLDNQLESCDLAGTDRFSCYELSYGFHWTDLAGGLRTATRVDVRFESGFNCWGTSSSVTLNGAPIGTFDLVGTCDCDSVHGTISFPNVDAGAYVLSGLNTIAITPSGACEGLRASTSLGNSFARITVTYLPEAHVCQVGVCNPGTGACEFSTAPDGTECTDDDPCTTGDMCGGGVCSGAPLDCNDNNPCTDDSCDQGLGCVHVPAPYGTTCDDQNVCDGVELCDGYGTCVSSYPPQCDDHVLCTEDSCDPLVGCVYQPYPAGTSCSDGNACNGLEHCDGAGLCANGAAPRCSDNNPCTTDTCNPETGCVFSNNSAACNDGNACTVGDTCGGGSCNAGTPSVCNDGNVCNGVESCNAASGCVAGTPLNCTDNNACTTDTCNAATGCVFANNTIACSDGNACTVGDTCGAGACNAGTPRVCNDGDTCNGVESCNPTSGCIAGSPLTCNDNNPCTTDGCNAATGCVFINNTNACNDGNACTRTDVCSAGACVGGSPVTCAASDQCHTAGVCSPATGACTNPIMPNGTVCDDASLCTNGETCQSGTCTPAHSGLNHPRPRTSGYYRRICDRRGHDHHSYQGDQLTDADAVCVGQLTSTFAGISTVDELCDVIDSDRRPPHGGRHHGGPGDGPYGRDCDKGENELIATALNICRARVCEEQSLDSHCHGNTHTTVSQSFADADAILDDAARDHHTCRNATCELREINNGHALEMNSLLLSMEDNKVRLTWSSPVLDDGSGSPSSYELWRRPLGSDDAFTKIGTTTGLTFLDVTGGTAAWEYDVTAVIPGD